MAWHPGDTCPIVTDGKQKCAAALARVKHGQMLIPFMGESLGHSQVSHPSQVLAKCEGNLEGVLGENGDEY